MNQKSIFPKIATDLFSVQLIWTLWFIGFVLAARIITIIVLVNTGNSMGNFLHFAHGSTKIYMLVIGIISIYGFLEFYVNHGVTRRDYFKGSFLAAAGISMALTLISATLTGVEYIILELTNISSVIEPVTGDNQIGFYIPKEIFDSSILLNSTNWLLSMIMFVLNILTFYVIGWIIGAGYYRYGWIIGFGFVAIGIASIFTSDLLWGTEIEEPLSNWLPFDSINLPLYGSIIGNIILIGILLSAIRLLTKRIAIKM
ncbi:hypothetical protein [Virgibacillus ainsalahensis]